MKNADESWSSARVFLPRSFRPLRTFFPLPLSALPLHRHPSSRPRTYGRVQRGRGREGGKGEFTGRSKSFARKAKTLANGCFSWAEYLKKGGREGGGERWTGVCGGRRKRETAKIKTRELLPLLPSCLSFSFRCLFFRLPLPFLLPLLRYVSARETKKCNLPLLGDTLPRVQPSRPSCSREKRVTSAELAIL